MGDKYICKRCKAAGAKSLIPYKIVCDDGNTTKFMGQLCERCFKEIFDSPPKTEEKVEKVDEEQKQEEK